VKGPHGDIYIEAATLCSNSAMTGHSLEQVWQQLQAGTLQWGRV